MDGMLSSVKSWFLLHQPMLLGDMIITTLVASMAMMVMFERS